MGGGLRKISESRPRYVDHQRVDFVEPQSVSGASIGGERADSQADDSDMYCALLELCVDRAADTAVDSGSCGNSLAIRGDELAAREMPPRPDSL